MQNQISTKPLKGFRDFLPKDIAVRNYIFNTWRRVANRYNFDEYDGPILENIAVYNKSGEDVGSLGKELYKFTDRGGRDVALRPEMTPTVGRMIAEYSNDLIKPIRWFSIGQFFRSENPQKGRGREFYQLNADIFGSDSVSADIEIIQFCIDIMLEFDATPEMFKLYINNRKFITAYFTKMLKLDDISSQQKLVRIIDAYPKKGDQFLQDKIQEFFADKIDINLVKKYTSLKISDLENEYKNLDGVNDIIETINRLKQNGYGEYIEFNPTMSRGFDYYTGVVFEVFDTNKENNRSMFGGGRYDDLLTIFDKPKMPAVGVAPGDITTQLFLETWGLMPDFTKSKEISVFIVNFSDQTLNEASQITTSLREKEIRTEQSLNLSESLSDQLKYASKKGFKFAVIVGEDEVKKQEYTVKNLENFEQVKVKTGELVEYFLSKS